MIRLCRCGNPIRGQYGDRCEDCWLDGTEIVRLHRDVIRAANLIAGVEALSLPGSRVYVVDTTSGPSILTVTDRGATMT